MEQVRRLAGAGYKEIVLTGIHLGGYGQDLQPKNRSDGARGNDRRERIDFPPALELPRSARGAGSIARSDRGFEISFVRICMFARKRAMTRSSSKCGATTTRRIIAISWRACASVCPKPRWEVTSLSDFPARATPSLKLLWSILTRCR